MPDVSYYVYRRTTLGYLLDGSTDGPSDATEVLVFIGNAEALNPAQAVRKLYANGAKPTTDALESGSLTVIPQRNHHELKSSIESQPRLVVDFE